MALYLGVQQGTLAGDFWQTGFYWRNSTLDMEGARNVWGATMSNLFTIPVPPGQAYTNLMDIGDVIGNSWVYRIDETTDQKVAKSAVSVNAFTGSSGKTLGPTRESVLVLLYPAVRTRAIGRMYLPRIAASNLPNGELSPATLNEIKAMVNQAMASMIGNLGTPVIRNRRTHTDQPVSQWFVSNRLAVLDSRRRTTLPTYT